MSMIEFSGVNLSFDGKTNALEDVNIFIDSGEFVFLMGSTGSGKSSFLRLICRDLLPRSGEVYINNMDITELPGLKVPCLRRRIGVVFQDFKLLDYKTVEENISYALEVTGYEPAKIPDRVNTVLEVVGLADKRKRFPEELSGGEKQLTSIARALVHNPRILLADEPTGNLDTDSAWRVMEIIDYINTRGTTVIVATHDEKIVKAMKKRVIYMDKGRIILDNGAKGTKDVKEVPGLQEI